MGSRSRLMLGLVDVLLHFGFLERTTWIWSLCLIRDGSDSATLLLWFKLLLNTFLGETSLNGFVWSVAISAPSTGKQPISCLVLWKLRFGAIMRRNSIHYFQRNFDWRFQWMIPYQFICSVILWVQSWGNLRLLLRLVKIVLEFGLSGHAARDCRLGWLRMDLMVRWCNNTAILLLRLSVRVGYV